MQLLNARRRHRRGHSSSVTHPDDCLYRCSTPEGVIVEGTSHAGLSRSRNRAAQRPKASSSRAHRMLANVMYRLDTAQRPKASSSRARASNSSRSKASYLLNARRRHRRGHGEAGRPPVRAGGLLNARRRHRRGHLERGGDRPGRRLLLNARRRHRRGHRGRPGSPRSGRSPAQRPKASSSRAPINGETWTETSLLLNARRRHRRGHAALARPAPWPCEPAQRPKASSSRAPGRRSSASTCRSAAQRPKASSSRAPPDSHGSSRP